MKDLKLTCDVFKLDNEDEQLVGGIVYEPDVVDSQGDSASAKEIEKAQHDFLECVARGESGVGIMHTEEAGPRVSIVECAIAHDTFRMGNQQIKKGTWFMVVKIHDPEIWAAVKAGKYTGFSMGGSAESE